MPSLAPDGSIIVTLFEGVPYTLWNIRDLARHSGLAVERSFKFQASAYPGYHHARTLGVVKNKKGEESGTGWRGEERAARSYVFVRKGEEKAQAQKRKRASDGESDSEEDVVENVESEGENVGSDVDDMEDKENDDTEEDGHDD
jgi:25S rRNA (uracil2634-N3)-methyltransferase